MVTRCSFCDELITVENKGQFFPEDDSYICGICQREHKRTLEKMEVIQTGNQQSSRRRLPGESALVDPVQACLEKSF